MNREDRYLVLKRSDITKYLTVQQQVELGGLLGIIREGRMSDNKNINKDYVVVSEDWPMYEDTWQAIAEWVDNEHAYTDSLGIGVSDNV